MAAAQRETDAALDARSRAARDDAIKARCEEQSALQLSKLKAELEATKQQLTEATEALADLRASDFMTGSSSSFLSNWGCPGCFEERQAGQNKNMPKPSQTDLDKYLQQPCFDACSLLPRNLF